MQSDKNNDILDAHIIPHSGLCPHGMKYRDIVDPIIIGNKIQQVYTLLLHSIVKSFSDKIFNAKLLRNEQPCQSIFSADCIMIILALHLLFHILCKNLNAE